MSEVTEGKSPVPVLTEGRSPVPVLTEGKSPVPSRTVEAIGYKLLSIYLLCPGEVGLEPFGSTRKLCDLCDLEFA